MGVNTYLLFALLLSFFVIIYLVAKLHRIREQLLIIKDALTDIKTGNLNSRYNSNFYVSSIFCYCISKR